MHVSFNRIGQVAPVCTPTSHMVPLAHTSLPHKRHLDQFIHFCRIHQCAQHTETLQQTQRP